MEKNNDKTITPRTTLLLAGFSLSLLIVGIIAMLVIEPSVRNFIQKESENLRWLVLVEGDVLEVDHVGAQLARLPDVREVKFYSSVDLIAALSKNTKQFENMSEIEKLTLPSAWSVLWKQSAVALNDPSSIVNEIRSYPHVVDVAYEQSLINQIVLLMKIQRQLHWVRSMLMFGVFLYLMAGLWILLSGRHKKKMLLLVWWAILPVFGAPKTSSELKTKNRDLEKINEELSRIKQEKEKLSSEASELQKTLEKKQIQIKDVEQSLLYTKQRTIELESTVAAEKNKKDYVEFEMQTQKGRVVQAATSLAVASLLLGNESPVPSTLRQLTISRIKDLNQKKTSHEHQKIVFSELSLDLSALRRELVNQQRSVDDIRNTIDEKEKLKKKKMTRAELLELERNQLERSKQELSSLIENLRSKAEQEKREAQEAREAKAAQGRSPIMTRSLPWPLMGKVIKRFGRQAGMDAGETFISNGIVIERPTEEPVLCVADGTVLFAGQFMSYGAMVVIEHAGDWYSVYGYLKEWLVQKGIPIKKGEPVGMSGPSDTGKSQAYFEIRFYGKPVNPEPWLAQP